MKRPYIFMLASIMMLIITAATSVNAQTTIYFQTFDSSNTALPTGWSGDANGWVIDSTGANADSVAGVSQLNNVVIRNASGLSGTYNLFSNTISTIGYNSISVLWSARFSKHYADSGSTITFQYSTNGTNWATVTYAENAGDTVKNSLWAVENQGIRIILPGDAAGQAMLQFRWMAVLHGNPSGTYRIDDFSVDANSTTGINEYKDQNIFKAFADGNKMLHLNAKLSFQLPASSYVTISDVTGRICLHENITSNESTISLSDFRTGIYYVKVVAGSLSFVQKVICY